MDKSDYLQADKLEERDVQKPTLRFGRNPFDDQAVLKSRITEYRGKNHMYRTASVIVKSSSNHRWDYRAQTSLDDGEVTIHTGVCTKAEQASDGTVVLNLHDLSWHMNRTKIENLAFFGMTRREMMYWLPLLSGLVEEVEIDDLHLDEKMRPFVYAVPLQGLAALGDLQPLYLNDLGIVGGEMDNTFAPLLAELGADKRNPVWHADVPKACGVVFATGMLQAERRALDRAQFTADIVNFALSAGLSHFATRYETQILKWDAEAVQATVSLHPLILLREYGVPKGWIRSVPLVQNPSHGNLRNGNERIKMFAQRFLDASSVGDIRDQAGRRTLTDRERKLAEGIQRALRWYGIASREPAVGDQFLAIWVALESILECMDYPQVFAGKRSWVRDFVLGTIDLLEINEPDSGAVDDLLVVTPSMLRNRLLQNTWPLKKKLEIFTRSFGVELLANDLKLVGTLSSVRGRILHSGRDDSQISLEQLRELQYLVERLLVAASVGAYRDLEERERHRLRFGLIGPEGGLAPVSLDDRAVSYRFTVSSDAQGTQSWEFAIEGKIYDSSNSDLGRT